MPEPLPLDRANDGKWRFCPGANCRVVYFADDGGAVFTMDDMRVRTGLKAAQ